MEQSSKFLSLSGLSGVFAGLTALAGASWAWLEIEYFETRWLHYHASGSVDTKIQELEFRLGLIALLVLIFAITFGVFFTWLKAKRQQKSILTNLSLRLVISLMVPLAFGGAFTLGLYYHEAYFFVAPATLIFYGMALLNASKYVHLDIKYLALCQMALGVISLFNLGNGIYYWAVGFGVLHIFYGIIMYLKYDRNSP